MLLRDILSGVKFKTADDISGLAVDRICDDSRLVRKTDLFIAVKGYSQDGSKFIDEAVSKGAGIIISEGSFRAPKGVRKISVKDTRLALSVIASNFYNHPSVKLKVIGVTGTNGKTTVTYLMEGVIKAAGENAGVIGTINYRLNGKALPAKNTTPGPLELQGILSEMVNANFRYAVMEVSSHSLDQRRVNGVLFDVGIFTNITSDHLDYHKTAENYFKAKVKLLGLIKKGGACVLNNDDEKVAALIRSLKNRVITYGIKKDADVKAKDIELSLGGSKFIAATPAGDFQIRTTLIGMHNVSNILACVAASSALGLKPDSVRKGIESVSCVPGRLEPIDLGQPYKVFVDYAHTEDALFNVLGLLREAAKKNIITVFGCGGNRDKTKRPLMGKVACKFSDRVIITSDNPRHEEPSGIIKDIEEGVRGIFNNYDIVEDRSSAIEKALSMASAGDIVIIAGKGHESYQIIRDKVVHFDDREVASSILKEMYEPSPSLEGKWVGRRAG